MDNFNLFEDSDLHNLEISLDDSDGFESQSIGYDLHNLNISFNLEKSDGFESLPLENDLDNLNISLNLDNLDEFEIPMLKKTTKSDFPKSKGINKNPKILHIDY